MNKKLSLVAISTIALIAGCGGGGADSTTSTATPNSPSAPVTSQPVITGHLSEVPLQNTMPQHAYPVNSGEAHAFEKLNRARIECGFGSMIQDVRLDKMAMNHSRYLLKEGFPNVGLSHVETNKNNPFFTGTQSWDRAKIVGFLTTETNFNGVGEDISGGVLPAETFTKGESLGRYIELLLSAPYHALDMLAPRTQMGVNISWPENSNIPNILPGGGAVHSPVVTTVSPGSSTNSNQQTQIHQWPADDVLTWPCNGTTNTLLTYMTPETVDVFNNTRNYTLNPVGTPFYIVSKHGSNLNITSQKLIEVSTGASVPLLPARYGKKEIYPGTNETHTSAKLMDWAFIMPDVALENSKRYRMEFTATVNGKTVARTVEFTPKSALFTF